MSCYDMKRCRDLEQAAYFGPVMTPTWRGPAARKFMKITPPPGYHIHDRIQDIVSNFPPFSDTDTEDKSTEYETESDSDSEEEHLKKLYELKMKNERKMKNELKMKMRKRMKKEIQYSDTEDEIWDESEDEEELLDELQAYVESLDVVRALDKENLLFRFLRYALSNQHAARIRAKGAEVVATLVQSYPASQHLVIKERGLHRLLRNFNTDPDVTSRTKALGAISSLIRNNEPGITAFRLANGYAALRDALSSESVSFQREVLNLIQYLLHENSSDCNIVTELGIPRIMTHLASNDDLEVRESALRGLLILARDEGGNSGQLVKNDDKLKQVLEARIEKISAMAPEDVGAARKERQLVDSLWNACYNEPSSLGGKLVEPSLIVCAAAQAADRNYVGEKKEAPLLIGPDPPSAATHTVQSESISKRRKKKEKKEKREKKSESSSKRGKRRKRVGKEGISAMAQLVDSLWNVCYNEPSSLGEKSLLVLPGEDAPAPNVASKLVEPSLIACAAAQAVDRNYVSEKKEVPLLLGPDPPFAATPTVQSESSWRRGEKKQKKENRGKKRVKLEKGEKKKDKKEKSGKRRKLH